MTARTYLRLVKILKAAAIGLIGAGVISTIIETVKDAKETVDDEQLKAEADAVQEAIKVNEDITCANDEGYYDETATDSLHESIINEAKERSAFTKKKRRKIFVKALPKHFINNAKMIVPAMTPAIAVLAAIRVGEQASSCKALIEAKQKVSRWVPNDGHAPDRLEQAFMVAASTAEDYGYTKPNQGVIYYNDGKYNLMHRITDVVLTGEDGIITAKSAFCQA